MLFNFLILTFYLKLENGNKFLFYIKKIAYKYSKFWYKKYIFIANNGVYKIIMLYKYINNNLC